ncbi:hypothetical protein TNCV_4124791 [Trichonephila clavipes]|nr:hypothetical protein TNCV_4124791 [Trichonephila clavipes]
MVCDEVEELLDSYNQEMTIDELIEMHEPKARNCRTSPPGGAIACQLLNRLIDRQVANRVTMVALSPIFRYVSNEPP